MISSASVTHGGDLNSDSTRTGGGNSDPLRPCIGVIASVGMSLRV